MKKGNNKNLLLITYCLLFTVYYLLFHGCGAGKRGEVIEYGSLQGKAMLEGQTDFTGIDIRLEGNTILSTVTNLQGEFEFPQVQVGDYKLIASKTGYETRTRDIKILRGLNTLSTPIFLSVTLQKLIEQAWDNFRVGSYESAKNDFDGVLRRTTDNALKESAYNGLGWTYFVAPSPIKNIDNAILNFNKALELNSNNLDAIAGKVGALMAQVESKISLGEDMTKNIDEIIKLGEKLLTTNPNYYFTEDPTFDYIDIHTALTIAYLLKENATKACEHANKIGIDNVWAQEVNKIYNCW